MAKKIVGVYDTELEVMEAVDRLEVAGYRPEEITMVAKNSGNSLWLESEGIDTTTTSDLTRSEQKEDETFWQKVKNVFTSESKDYSDTEGFTSRFSKYGLSDEDAEQYNAEVQRGKIVLLASETNTVAFNAATETDEFRSTLQINQQETINLDEDLGSEPNNRKEKEKSLFARDYDVAFLKEGENETGEKLRPERKWDINNPDDDDRL